MKEYIGGFLEFELFSQPGLGYHTEALAFHNARACISHIINQTQMQAVWLPYYTCNALLQPFETAGISYRFYALTEELELDSLPELEANEYIIYINYFGIKNEYVQYLLGHYLNHLLIDNTQDFFARGYNTGWSFNSARKSFGVPDGGYLYGPSEQLGKAVDYPINTDYHVQYLVDRLRGKQGAAYEGFIAYEQTLNSKPLQISNLSASLLSQVDYADVAMRRQDNYQRYHAAFSTMNELPIPLDLDELPPNTVPFCYPLMLKIGKKIDRQALFAQKIFVAWLWPDVLTRQSKEYNWERRLTEEVLPLPVDHRYGAAEVDRVIMAMKLLIITLK